VFTSPIIEQASPDLKCDSRSKIEQFGRPLMPLRFQQYAVFSMTCVEIQIGQYPAITSGMNTASQTSNMQVQFGLRWTIAALLILLALGSAHAQQRNTATAQLHIRVTVMPMLQAMQSAQTAAQVAEPSAGVAYHLRPVRLQQNFEVRDKLATTRLVGSPSAVLETITTVAE
jgi:hypothetical protein